MAGALTGFCSLDLRVSIGTGGQSVPPQPVPDGRGTALDLRGDLMDLEPANHQRFEPVARQAAATAMPGGVRRRQVVFVAQ